VDVALALNHWPYLLLRWIAQRFKFGKRKKWTGRAQSEPSDDCPAYK
jgi:hypothetical protein